MPEQFLAPLRCRTLAIVGILGTLGLAGCGRSSSPQNVLLVTWDTTRVDRLGCYGGPPDTTPHLDRLASESVVFRRAYAPVPLTLPSHTTLLTGMHPRSHGVMDNGLFRVPDFLPLWSELLQSEGYATAAFVASFVLDRQFGLSRGFDHYDDVGGSPSQSGKFIDERPADEVTESALAWLQAHASGPFSLWVHYYDPHFPHQPPADLAAEFPQRLYDAEIAAVDRAFGRLIQALKERGVFDQTLIIMTSDHGEGLGDHGEKAHGYLLYQSTMHVPLVLRAPGLPPGECGATVGLVDVLPTTLELLGLPIPTSVDGRSLLPLLESDQDPAAVFLESDLPRISLGFAPVAAVVQNGHKYIGAPHPELYDLSRDPSEQHNLLADAPERAGSLPSTLADYLATTPPPATREVSEDDRDRIAALGYTAGDEKQAVMQSRWTNEELLRVVDLRDRARDHLLAGRNDRCLQDSRQLIELAPQSYQGYEYAGTALARLGQFDRAIERLHQALELCADLPNAHWNLSTCHFRKGDLNAALAAAERVVELDPSHSQARRILAEMALRRGQSEHAKQHMKKLLETAPNSAEAAWARSALREL